MWQNPDKPVAQRLLSFGAFVMATFVITIYLSTALAIIVSCVLGVLWLLTSQFKHLPKILTLSSTATWALLLYACFFIGLSYGDATTGEAFSTIRKYRELLFIPLLSCFFTEERFRTLAWQAFIAASVLTLVGSYLMDLGLLDMNRHKSFSLKSRITHSIFIAFFTFYCAHNVFLGKKYRIYYLIALLLGTYNLFFVVEGRTGQLVFMMLAFLFAGQRFDKKGLLAAILCISVLTALYFNFSDKSARLHEGIANTMAYINHVPEKRRSSMGVRYKFWENSLKLIAEKPLLGHGTGSFAEEYGELAGPKKPVQNPHNEFLLMAVQFGLLGMVAYLGFLFSQYWGSRALPEHDKWLAQGLLVTLITTSLFNSPFLDHTEGHWFAVMMALCLASKTPTNSLG